MASFVDMSLEDIIQKKKKGARSNPELNKSFKNPKMNQKKDFTDARNKIIAKKRTHITDAREKLAELAKQRDARFKLEQLRQKKSGVAKAVARNRVPMTNAYDMQAKRTRSTPNYQMVFQDHTRQVKSQTRQLISKAPTRHQINANKFMETRSFGTRNSDSLPRLKPIVRTIENNVVRLEDDDDPMGIDFTHQMHASLNRKASLNLKIVAHNTDARSKTSGRRTPLEREKSPPRLTSILKKRPMAALRTEKKFEKKEVAASEYRIIVSNLRNTVTSGDIEELFGDVGGMIESRLARPGIAEVIYKTQEDAQRAVELYHNRQLDGQPMTCLLVTPRTTAAPSRNNVNVAKPALPPSSNSNVEPDLSTFHKVLFSNF